MHRRPGGSEQGALLECRCVATPGALPASLATAGTSTRLPTSRSALSARPVLALDLGGTQVRAAVILPDGSRVARIATETPKAKGPDAVVAACVEALRMSRARAPREIAQAVAGIGVSSPGPIDPWRGVIVEPPNLGPEFHDIPIAPPLEEALQLPVYLERDTNVAALAEQSFGAARDCPDFLYLTVSTGIGGAIVSAGQLIYGPDASAGELGHVPVNLDGPVCGCGGIAHLEAYAAGAGLARFAREAVAAGTSPFLADRAAADGVDALGAHDVADGEDAGDAVCGVLMAQARTAFSVACAGYVNIFNPSRIVVGGTIAEKQGDRLLGPARDYVARYSLKTPRRRVQIVSAELGPDVSLVGALPIVTARLGDPRWRSGRTDVTAVASA
jgi:glucokinase